MYVPVSHLNVPGAALHLVELERVRNLLNAESLGHVLFVGVDGQDRVRVRVRVRVGVRVGAGVLAARVDEQDGVMQLP